MTMNFDNKVKLFFDDTSISRKTNFYGSIESKTNDKYSDIDIEVTPKNINEFYKNFKKNLKLINNYYVIFPVVVNDNPQVFTIVWKGQSLYKKLDLRVNAKLDTNLVKKSYDFDENLRPFYDLYIGALRFIKYRKRKDLIASMKFYRSAHEYLMRVSSKPKTLHKYFFLENNSMIDIYFIEILKKYLKVSLSSKLIVKNSIHNKFALDVIKFAQNELIRTRS